MTRASIDIITDFVPQPIMRACCGMNCVDFIQAPFDPAAPQQESLQRFLTQAEFLGWKIGLFGNLCPRHLAKAREQQSLITPASSMPPIPPPEESRFKH